MHATLKLFKEASLSRAFRILRLSRRPIIIGGCGRSGTTLLLSILSCHRNIFAIAEETVALCPDGYGADGLYNKNPNLNVPLDLWKIYRYLLAQPIDPTCKRWCEKTPRNVLYFARILRHFRERVHLIHLVRDGRDVITSTHPTDPSRFWVTPDRWLQDVSAGRRLENHPQVFTLRYEDLLTTYEPTMRRLCEFLEEDFDPAILAYPETARVNQSLAWSGKARPIDLSSIGRWRDPRHSQIIESFLADPQVTGILQHYGYALD